MNNLSKNLKHEARIVIVGAGPAGTALAIRLVRENFRVILIERDKFPRQKLCGEFVSPECLEHFRELGVLSAMLAVGGERITRTVFYEPGGRSVVVPSSWLGSTAALSISRAEMDSRLIERARTEGVEVLEESRVVAVLQQNERVTGVRVKNRSGGVSEILADLTVDATGRAGVLGKLIERTNQLTNRNGKKRSKTRMVGFKTHLRNASPEPGVCEIYFFRGGYGGLSFIEDGLANHCFLIKSEIAKEFGGDAGKIVEFVVSGNKRAKAALAESEPAYEWLAVSVDGFGERELHPAPALFSVGDASAFIDPFTGSGMLMALQGAEILAQTIVENRLRTDLIADRYRTRHRQNFRGRLRLCSLMRRAAFVPALAGHAISVLSMSRRASKILARSTRKAAMADSNK